MEPIIQFGGRIVPLAINDIDTDQIIPARFLKTTDKKGLGDSCFFDWRYLADGSPNPDFILNQPKYADASVLIAGNNFGCGSSREHAPWALMGMGFRAVVSTDFADIFRSNALKNGLIPVIVDAETHRQLMSLAEEDPKTQVSISLETQSITLPDGRNVNFPIDSFTRYCLMNGVDQLGFLLGLGDAVAEFESANSAPVQTTAL